MVEFGEGGAFLVALRQEPDDKEFHMLDHGGVVLGERSGCC